MAFQPIRIDKIGYQYQPIKGQVVPGGGGPGPEPPVAGFTWFDGAFASRPAVGASSDDAFSANNDYVFQRNDGTAWLSWGPIYPMIEPPTTGWSWVNQGTSTIDETKGALMMKCPSGNSNLRCRVRTMPTPPWSLTISFTSTLFYVIYSGSGIVLRDSNSGRLITFGWQYSTNFRLRITNWTNSTTLTSYPTSNTYYASDPAWLRVVDDNTNFTFFYSHNGEHWIQAYQVSRTAWLVSPDQIGFSVSCINGFESAMTVFSWELS